MLGTRDQQAQLALSNCEALYSAFAQKLCGRSFESGCTALQPDQAAGAGGFRDCFDLVQLLAGERRTTGDLQTANAAAGSQHVVRHRKLRPAKGVACIEQLEGVTRVRTIDPESLHHVGVTQALERRRNLDPGVLPQRAEQSL